MFSPTGWFSLAIVAAGRDKTASNNPRDPVGPVLAYFGTYTVDETAKTFTYQIEGCTFPRWDGIARAAKIETLTDSELTLEASAAQDPSLGDIVPHDSWKRATQ